MIEAILLLGGTAFSILGAAFFTSSEIALISSDKHHLKRLKEKGVRRAELALALVDNIDQLLTTTQFGANLTTSLATTLVTIFASRHLHSTDSWLALVIFAPCMLIFSDSLPKVIGRHRADRISLFAAYPLQFFQRCAYPAIALVSVYTRRLSKMMGIGLLDALTRRKKLREELHSLLQDSDNDSEIRLGHRRIIRKILGFAQQTVKKVMIPLVNMDAIPNTASITQAVEQFETLRHSRLPVYEERIDNIVGILHFQDIFFAKDSDDQITRFVKPALYVPEHQLLEALTGEMRTANAHIAIVVDEYGGAVGLVTKEDVLEEIVGNISDEFDEHTLTLHEMAPNTYLVHVNMEIHELNERLGTRIPKGDYETVSGFLLQQFNRIPAEGDELFFANLRFRVHRANERAIETVIVEIMQQSQEGIRDE